MPRVGNFSGCLCTCQLQTGRLSPAELSPSLPGKLRYCGYRVIVNCPYSSQSASNSERSHVEEGFPGNRVARDRLSECHQVTRRVPCFRRSAPGWPCVTNWHYSCDLRH